MSELNAGLYEKDQQRICKGQTWGCPALLAQRWPRIFGIILDCSFSGGVLAELNRDRNPLRQAQAGRERTCPQGCPDICLSADVTSVVGSKGVVKLNIDPIVRSETGQGPEH